MPGYTGVHIEGGMSKVSDFGMGPDRSAPGRKPAAKVKKAKSTFKQEGAYKVKRRSGVTPGGKKYSATRAYIPGDKKPIISIAKVASKKRGIEANHESQSTYRASTKGNPITGRQRNKTIKNEMKPSVEKTKKTAIKRPDGLMNTLQGRLPSKLDGPLGKNSTFKRK